MFSCGASINTEVKRSNNCVSLSGDCVDCLSNLYNKGIDKPDRKSCFSCIQYDACSSGTYSLPSVSGSSNNKDEDGSDE
jgi:hypothetical protein